MKKNYNLADLDWSLEGYTPFVWLFERKYSSLGEGYKCIDVHPVPASVPGSVQGALRAAGILPDWNIGMNYRQCEWVEHRHWMYRTHIPDDWMDSEAKFHLECQGLDYSGWVLVNGEEAGKFMGTHIPHLFDLTPFLKPVGNILEIVFDLSPRWLGQFGFTSQMKEWKPRFNYTWDWSPRLVQIGIWDEISLAAIKAGEIQNLRCSTDLDLVNGRGILEVSGETDGLDGAWIEIVLTGEAGTAAGSGWRPPGAGGLPGADTCWGIRAGDSPGRPGRRCLVA